MALKSKGTAPPSCPIADANQAMALLNAVHFWCAKRVNRSGVSGVEVNITHAGRRVSAQRRTFVEATAAAFDKLRDPTKGREDGKPKPPALRIAQ